jgi:hypothetical protein
LSHNIYLSTTFSATLIFENKGAIAMDTTNAIIRDTTIEILKNTRIIANSEIIIMNEITPLTAMSP